MATNIGADSELPSVLNPPSPFFKGPIDIARNTLKHRGMVFQFVKKDIRVKYRGSILGYVWALLGPILQATMYYCLIVLIKGGGYPRQPLWLFGGLILYSFFRETTNMSMKSLVMNGSIIKNIYIPRELFSFSKLISNFIFLLLSMVVLIPLLLHYGFEINQYQLWVPLSIIGMGAIGIGIGLILCCPNTIFPDVGMFMGYVLRVGFFLSPILWTIDRIPEDWLFVYLVINPLAVFLTMFRYGLDGTELPIPLETIPIAFATTAILLLLGMCMFKKFEGEVIRYI